MPLIMVGQNLQDRYGELVANADFDIASALKPRSARSSST